MKEFYHLVFKIIKYNATKYIFSYLWRIIFYKWPPFSQLPSCNLIRAFCSTLCNVPVVNPLISVLILFLSSHRLIHIYKLLQKEVELTKQINGDAIGILFCEIINLSIELSSSSSCRAISTDIPDPFSPSFPIVHCFRQVVRFKSRIGTELLYVGSSWSYSLWSSMWRCPQEYIIYEFVLTSPGVSRMSASFNLDSFRDGW